MASVDGSRSYLAGSDKVLQHICGPCKDDGEEKEAKYFCEFCKIHLCLDCRNDHKTFKATKNHSIVFAYLTSGQGSTADKEAFVIFCSCDQKRAVEVYCEKHTKVICSTCETIKHRNCKTCPIKDIVSKDTKKKFRGVMDTAKSLRTRIESCKQDGEAGRKKIEGTKEECKKEITTFRKEINELLDNMEKEILQSLDENVNQHLQALEKQISVLSATLQALAADLDTIENANKTNKEHVMFSADVKISKHISEYDELVQDIKNGMQQPKFEFQKNKKLTDMLESMDVLGRIETPEASSIQHDRTTVMLDMKVKSTKKVNIKLSDDINNPIIAGCTFLPNGCVLLCDYVNKKVKMLDSDMSVNKSLKLSYNPYHVAALSENEAICTFQNSEVKDLQYIYTFPDLKLGKRIVLPDKCLGLHVVNDEIYTACHKCPGKDEIWKLDRAGNIMRKIVLTQSSSGRSEYLCLGSLADPNPRVYLTDWCNSKVTCLRLDDRMVYPYENKELKRPNGIYVDSKGNSLVCGSDSSNVVVITADGRKYGELLTSKDITNPKCIAFRPEDATLIVGCEKNSKLFVFKLGR